MGLIAVKRGSDNYQGTEQSNHPYDSEDNIGLCEVNHFYFDN